MGKLDEVISKIRERKLDGTLLDKTQKRLDNLTKPLGSLGRLEELAKTIVGITGKEKPVFNKKVIFTMAGDHGVTEDGVSAYPKEVTPQMVYNFLRGGAGINVLARHIGAKVIVVDMGVAADLSQDTVVGTPLVEKTGELVIKKINYGTKNFLKGPAMTKEEAIASIEAGIDVVMEEYNRNGIDIIGTGDMGIGNTTPSSAIVSVFTKEEVRKVTGRGTGIDDKTLDNKIKVIEKAIEMHKPNIKDAIDVLSKVGGFEIGGIAGVILAGVYLKIPVVVDGFISGAGALIACALEPKVKDFIIAGHCSVEIGHKVALQYLGISPLLDFNMRLGEGTGASLGISIVDASVKILNEMATFAEAGVSEKN
jgi:nicotinate-nucleotide--dimethylbenzimidazole phosphoribosyltransferase